MATVNGNIVEIPIVEHAYATSGRYVTIEGVAVLLEQAVEGDLLLLRARDSGVGGVSYVFWTSVDPNSNPPPGYVGPLTNKVVLRMLPRRGAQPVLMENGSVVLME